MREYRMIDADCHVVEPPHIWERWLPKQFSDRAPRLVKDEEGGDAWEFVPGGPLMHIGLVATPGMRFEDIKWKGYTYDTVRRGCWEGKSRLEDMDFDGVDAEFIYPSQRTMYYFMGNADRDFHRAGVRAYNDYMAQEFCAADPERLFFLAQMPNLGIKEGIAELERCKEMGARGCIITAWPAGGDDVSPPTTSSSAPRRISACRCRSTSGSSANEIPDPHSKDPRRSRAWRSRACCSSRRSCSS